MLLRKICLSFLDLRGCRRKRNASTHPGALFPFALVDAERKKGEKKGLAAFLRSLPGDPEAAPRGRDAAPIFLPPKHQCSPAKGTLSKQISGGTLRPS